MSALSCCDHSRVSTANNFCQDSELELERNSMGVLNLRLDSAIFCLVTTSQEGGMETRSAPVWLVNRAFALKFFVLCLNCIQIHVIFWLPVKSGAGCVYGDCPCLHSKVSEVKCISFWRRHIFLGFQYILGIMIAIWDSLVVVTWTMPAMLTGFESVGSPPSRDWFDQSGYNWAVMVGSCVFWGWQITIQSKEHNLFDSSLDSHLPEPHIVALLHQALLHLVPHLGKSNINNIRGLFADNYQNWERKLTRSGPILPSLSLSPRSASRAGPPVWN